MLELDKQTEQLQANSSPWWRREPLLIVELADPLHVTERGRGGLDAPHLVRQMRELNATAAHVFPMGCHLDGRKLFFKHRSAGDPTCAFDYLAEWLAHSRPGELRSIVYFNVHSVKAEYARLHADWQQHRGDGSPKEDLYVRESSFCVNSPWRDWVMARLRELCAYPIDGVFFDGPAFFDDTCFCQHCRAKFERRHGGEMPAKAAGSRLRLLVEFQSDSLRDFVGDCHDVIKSFGRELLFYVNGNPVQATRITGRDNRKLATVQDVVAAEGGFLGGNLLAEHPLWKVGLHAKLLETQASAARLPHLVFDSVIHNPWTFHTLSRAEAVLLWGSSVAHGAATWMSAYRDSMNSDAVRAIGPLYAFARRHSDKLFETKSAARVAVLVSSETLNYHANDVRDELYGWYHALWASHVPFDVIDEQTIERDELAGYQLVILPDSSCMSDAVATRLIRFTESGGTLIASFEAGMYREDGTRRDVGALDDLLGIRRSAAKAQGPRRWDYLLDHSEGNRLAHQGMMPSPLHALPVQPSDAQVLMTFSTALAEQYGGLPQDSGNPAILERRVGKGRAFYFACDFGAAIWSWRIPEHVRLVRQIVMRCAPPPVVLQDAPPCIDLSLRRQRNGRHLLLHLVNYNGGMTRPIERVLPLHDLGILVSEEVPVRGARALFDQIELKCTRHDGATRVVLPVLNEYELIELELE